MSASVHGGIPPPLEQTPQSRHPPGADTPLGADKPPRSRHPRSSPPRSRHPPEQTPPGADTPRSRHPTHPTPRADTPPGADTPQADTPQEQTPPYRSRHPPPQRNGHCCRRYASYWNAFLFPIILHVMTSSLDPLLIQEVIPSNSMYVEGVKSYFDF